MSDIDYVAYNVNVIQMSSASARACRQFKFETYSDQKQLFQMKTMNFQKNNQLNRTNNMKIYRWTHKPQ